MPVDPSPGQAPAGADAPRTRLEVVIVDDEPDILDALEAVWAMARIPGGVRVRTAATGEAALELLEAGPVDIVWSDFGLPGIDGAEVLRVARELHPSATRVLVTGFVAGYLEEGGVDLRSVEQFLGKPLDPAEVVAWIEENAGAA